MSGETMITMALFIDLPNLYGQLLGSKLGEPEFLKDYFLNWLDFDILAQRITGSFPTPNIWIFYSRAGFGPSKARISGKCLNEYIKRINFLEGVTARDVDIPGKQREAREDRCEKCGHETATEWKSEKGIDASLTVHLFDTADSWNTAYLLSGDSDFVPAVASLRRRGKIVIGAGFPSASLALIRECYDYMDLARIFFREDIVAYTLFKTDGLFQKWLTEVQAAPRPNSTELTLSLKWQYQLRDELDSRYLVRFGIAGSRNTAGLEREVEDLGIKFEYPVDTHYSQTSAVFTFFFDPIHWKGIERRLQTLISSIKGLEQFEKNGYIIKYCYEYDTNEYVLITK